MPRYNTYRRVETLVKKMSEQKDCKLTSTFAPKRKRVLNRKLRVLNKRTKVDKMDDALLDSQASMPGLLDSQASMPGLLDSQVPLTQSQLLSPDIAPLSQCSLTSSSFTVSVSPAKQAACKSSKCLVIFTYMLACHWCRLHSHSHSFCRQISRRCLSAA